MPRATSPASSRAPLRCSYRCADRSAAAPATTARAATARASAVGRARTRAAAAATAAARPGAGERRARSASACPGSACRWWRWRRSCDISGQTGERSPQLIYMANHSLCSTEMMFVGAREIAQPSPSLTLSQPTRIPCMMQCVVSPSASTTAWRCLIHTLAIRVRAVGWSRKALNCSCQCCYQRRIGQKPPQPLCPLVFAPGEPGNAGIPSSTVNRTVPSQSGVQRSTALSHGLGGRQYAMTAALRYHTVAYCNGGDSACGRVDAGERAAPAAHTPACCCPVGTARFSDDVVSDDGVVRLLLSMTLSTAYPLCIPPVPHLHVYISSLPPPTSPLLFPPQPNSVTSASPPISDPSLRPSP